MCCLSLDKLPNLQLGAESVLTPSTGKPTADALEDVVTCMIDDNL